jgi:hypothetical protein
MWDRAGPARRLCGSDAARGTGMRERLGCGSTSGAARSRGTSVPERLGSTFFYYISTVLTLFGTVQTAVPRIQYAEPAPEQCRNSAEQYRNSVKPCYMHACAAWLLGHAWPACVTARCRAAGPRDRRGTVRPCCGTTGPVEW